MRYLWSMTPTIEIEKLSKSYGKNRGIEDISFTVQAGEVFGFLGPNGAGKTTTIRAMVGLIKATSGSVRILGHDALQTSEELRSRIGYLPGALTLYPTLTGWEVLRFFATMRDRHLDREIAEYAERLNVDLHRKIHDLSKGNRQKIGVIQAFMHQPDVLLLDEPTSGLDPVVQKEFEIMLAETKSRGATVLLSSHVLSEVEHLADRVAIISEGKMVVSERISVLRDRAVRKIELAFDHEVQTRKYLEIAGVKEISQRGNKLTCVMAGKGTELFRLAVEDGVISIDTHETSLDEIFLSLVKIENPQ